MKIVQLLSLISFIFLAGCGITPLNTNYYSSDFLKAIESVNLIYKDGDKALALKKLRALPEEGLNKDEIAKKYNLLGVMLYRTGDLDGAIESLYQARQNVDRDPFLTNQIRLNLSSAFFKKNQFEKAYEEINKIDTSYVEADDIYDNGRIITERWNPMGRGAGNDWFKTDSVVEKTRLTKAQIQK